MKYKIEELEKMSKEDLIKTYRDAKTSLKKEILTSLEKSRKFAVLMGQLMPAELIEMAKIHPHKEVVVDTMIDEMESHGTQMAKYFAGNIFQKESFNEFMNTLQHKSIFARMKEKLTRKHALPEVLPKKIEQAKKLCEIEVRRANATGKKMEERETQGLDKAVDEPRAEVNNGEMAKIFDKYAKEACKHAPLFGMHMAETDVAHKVKSQLTEEYMSLLGAEKMDVARLVANAEFENYSGADLYIPYSGHFTAGPYDGKSSKTIGGATDTRHWKKNLLEVEQVQDFTVGQHNLGEVFVVKSEFSPTSYAIKGKWAPVYEYYTKNESGELVRIGSGKINQKTGKMEVTISVDGQDRSNDIRYQTEELEKAKEDGRIITFESNQYGGKSTKTSRKDIEQAITKKAIQEYLGNEKQIADVTQVKDIPVVTYDNKGNPHTKNAYMISHVENGFESYEMVCIGEDGKCEAYPGMNREMFAAKELYFPTGMSTGLDKQTSLNLIDKKQALEIFKSKDGVQYSAYRDKEGNLRVAEIREHANGTGKYAEELDTYSVMHSDIEKIKEQTKQYDDKSLSLLKQEEKITDLRLENKQDNAVSL